MIPRVPEQKNSHTLTTDRKMEARLPNAVVLLLFFISGALALIYQR